jgi:hypothetical protein
MIATSHRRPAVLATPTRFTSPNTTKGIPAMKTNILLRALVLLLTVAVALLSTGCASIMRGTSDTITITSLEEDTIIYVDEIPRGKNQAVAEVSRGEEHTIKVTKAGCQTMVVQTGKKFDMTSLLGILIDWGIISIPIDLVSGAAWKTHPKIYTVTPICDVPVK